MHLAPIASAAPNGFVRLHPSYNPSNRQLRRAEYAERIARLQPIFRQELEETYRWVDFLSSIVDGNEDGNLLPEELEARSIGLRKDARLNARGDYRRIEYSIGDAVSEERSRSHELKKSKLRLVRRGR